MYGDPASHWFNVFAGYYEIDVARAVWGRPFAYLRGEDGARQVDSAEVAALGSADWNYLAREDGGALVETVPVLTDVWRVAFGLPFVGARPPSFVATQMSAALFACFVEDGDVYRTYLFGGTVCDSWAAGDAEREAFNRAFLAAQVEAVKELISREFPHLGF